MLVAFGLMLFTSCTIRQEYVFDDDFSGKHVFQFDLSQEQEDGPGAGMGARMVEKFKEDSLAMDSMIRAMNAMEGISNAMVTAENEVISIGYNFADMKLIGAPIDRDNLGKMMGQRSAGTGDGDGVKFEWKGKKLHYTTGSISEGEDMPPMMEGMDEKIRFETIMTFANKVKKVNNPDYVISEDKKTLKLSLSMKQMLEGKTDEVVIEF